MRLSLDFIKGVFLRGQKHGGNAGIDSEHIFHKSVRVLTTKLVFE